MRLLDTVTLTGPLIDPAIPAGALGTIVDVYGDGEAYEVEFIDAAGQTLALVAVPADQLRPA